ncbi:MAG: HK97-fold major capsid protein [Ignavibacterium sp.]
MDESKVKEAIASLLKSNNREAVAEFIVEYVQPQRITTDFISMLFNVRNLKPGDSLVKKIRKGIEVRTLVPGSIHLASEITVSDRINYAIDGINVAVTANEWELESGELGTVEEIRQEMLYKLREAYFNRIFTALSTVWNATNTPNNYTFVGGNITATALENAIDRINQTTSGVKAVIGTRAAMSPVTKFAAFWKNGSDVGYSPNLIERIMREGQLGSYYGAPLFVIDQVRNNLEDNRALIPEDKIVVVGENVGEFVLYGDVKTKQYTDQRPTPPQWYLELYQQFGMLVWNAQGIYVIELT